MTGIMNQLYRALEALPAALSRAWPQQAQPLPAISFSLMDYQAGERGLDAVSIRVSARASLPEEADALAEQAAEALSPLGLMLASARDEAEADSGVFLKSLVFSGQASGGLLQRMSLFVKAGGAWLPLPGLRQAGFTPAEREYQDLRALSAAQPRLVPGEPRPASLRFSAAAAPESPAQQVITAAFQSGTALDWRLSGAGFTQEGRGLVTLLDATPLGFSAQLLIVL